MVFFTRHLAGLAAAMLTDERVDTTAAELAGQVVFDNETERSLALARKSPEECVY
jgi:hypothetical protein